MSEIIIQSILLLLSAIATSFLSFLLAKLSEFIKKKTYINNDKVIENSASNIVMKTVQSIYQTYVEELKKTNSFSLENQQEAFNKAQAIIINEMNSEIIQYITDKYCDLETWIKTEIESSISKLKKK